MYLAGSVLSGTYAGANAVTGGFSSLNTAGAAVTLYCGTFSGGGETGVFDMQVSAAGAVSGVAKSGDPKIIYITGQVSGNTFTFTGSDGGTGTGTIQGGTISGKTANGASFSGSTSACQ
jgi:hypothetical protein